MLRTSRWRRRPLFRIGQTVVAMQRSPGTGTFVAFVGLSHFPLQPLVAEAFVPLQPNGRLNAMHCSPGVVHHYTCLYLCVLRHMEKL